MLQARTLKGLARRWCWKVLVNASVNSMYNNFIHISSRNSCTNVKFEPVHDRTPACLRAGPPWGRTVGPLHSWGLGQCGGWRGPIHVPVNYHSIQLVIKYQQCQYHVSSYLATSYHPGCHNTTLAPPLPTHSLPLTHPLTPPHTPLSAPHPTLTHTYCCVPPTDLKYRPKWGKSVPKQRQWILTLRQLT